MSIADNIAQVLERISRAAGRVHRNPDSIALMAVSKTMEPERIKEAYAAGLRVFGENRVQEFEGKSGALSELKDAEWHLIGHLQSNKIRQALPLFEMFHGVDSVDLVDEIQRIAGELGLFPRVLLQVNVAGESSKFGFAPEKLLSQVEQVSSADRVQVEGLMTIPPLAANPENSRKYFVRLRELRDQLEKEFRFSLPHLSMGMSGDYRIAIEEGATFVRVGTAIFGERRAKRP